MIGLKNNKGFSLIEVMVAMVIATIGMLALGSFYMASIKSERISQERINAVHLAEQIIEDWQNTNIPPVPECKVGGVAAAALVLGTLLESCVPTDGVSTPFDILIDESDAKAPVPNGHLLHSTGDPLDAPEMRSLLTDPTYPLSATVKVRTIKVSWSLYGEALEIMLTHITGDI